MGSTADYNSGALSPAAAARQRKASSSSSGGGQQVVRCEDGVSFTVTEGNEVAEVARGGARVLSSESFLDAATGRRLHFVDVQGKKEAMMFLVSVDEDQRRIVDIKRCS